MSTALVLTSTRKPLGWARPASIYAHADGNNSHHCRGHECPPYVKRPPICDPACDFPTNLQAKKNRPAGRFLISKLITSKQPERQQQLRPKQPKQPKQPTKRQQQRPKRPKQPTKRQRLRQQQEQQPERPEQLQRQVPEQQERLLRACCKRSEQRPTGRRSAGIFSWVFLN
jgi:hypothetical protein